MWKRCEILETDIRMTNKREKRSVARTEKTEVELSKLVSALSTDRQIASTKTEITHHLNNTGNSVAHSVFTLNSLAVPLPNSISAED